MDAENDLDEDISLLECYVSGSHAGTIAVKTAFNRVCQYARRGAAVDAESMPTSKSQLRRITAQPGYCPGCGDEQSQAKYGKCHTHR